MYAPPPLCLAAAPSRGLSTSRAQATRHRFREWVQEHTRVRVLRKSVVHCWRTTFVRTAFRMWQKARPISFSRTGAPAALAPRPVRFRHTLNY